MLAKSTTTSKKETNLINKKIVAEQKKVEASSLNALNSYGKASINFKGAQRKIVDAGEEDVTTGQTETSSTHLKPNIQLFAQIHNKKKCFSHATHNSEL